MTINVFLRFMIASLMKEQWSMIALSFESHWYIYEGKLKAHNLPTTYTHVSDE